MALTRMKPARRAAVIYGASLLGLLACGSPPDEPQPDGGTSGMDGSTAAQCERNSECEDSLFCTTWRCVPGAAGADPRGCIEVGPPCALGEACVEELSRCVADTCGAVTDADGDGHDSAACGGDDCDDDDPNRYPGNPEVCDDAGHDEDCVPTTLAGDADGDADGDGEIDRGCCNGATCGADCDDADRALHPGARELCNGRDDDCDGVLDEAGSEGLCPGGTCIGGRCNLPAWDRVFGGTLTDIVWDVVMDDRGYVYAGGSFRGEASFGAAGAAEPAVGVASAFIAAYEPDGAYAWLRSIGGPGTDLVYRLAHAPGTDRLYAFVRVGFDGDANLGGGLRPPGAYIVAFDLEGTYLWDREAPFIEDIEATPDGVLAGGSLVPGFDLGGGPRTTDVVAAYIASYAADGSYRWDRLFEASDRIRIRELSYADGSIAATGAFSGSADFGEGHARPGSGTSASREEAFVVSLRDSASPTIEALYSSSGSGGGAHGLRVLLTSGYIHICGYVFGTEDLGLGPVSNQGFLLALGRDGTPLAQRTWGASGDESCAGIETTAGGSIFVAGTFGGTADFGGGPRSVTGSSAAFFARYRPDLSHRSDGVIDGTDTIQARGAAIGPADSTVIAGNMSGTADLGSGPRTSAGGLDGFIVRFAN